MPIDFDLPTDAAKQILVGAIFAESSTKFSGGGEDAGEKTAIVQAIINLAYYAGQSKMNGKKCYNSSFGDGTILGAVKKSIHAYGQTRWNLVMVNDTLKTKKILEKVLDQFDVAHLKNCAETVNLWSSATAPVSNDTLGGIPLQFNQAANSPPSPRMKKIGKAGAHTFYAFIAGRECQ